MSTDMTDETKTTTRYVRHQCHEAGYHRWCAWGFHGGNEPGLSYWHMARQCGYCQAWEYRNMTEQETAEFRRSQEGES